MKCFAGRSWQPLSFGLTLLLSFLLTIGSKTAVLGQIFEHNPVTIVGNVAIAPVQFDGRTLFYVASPLNNIDEPEQGESQLSVEQRVERIEQTLYGILRNADEANLRIEVAIRNNQTVIIASDDKTLKQITILTITDLDAQVNGIPVLELAEQGTDLITNALNQAWSEREFEHLLQRSLVALVLLLLILGISIAISYVAKKTRQHRLKNPSNNEHLNLIRRWLFLLSFPIIWLPSLGFILSLFPYTRGWGSIFSQQTLRMSIILILFLLSGKIIDVIYARYKPQDNYQKIIFKSFIEIVWWSIVLLFLILIIASILNQPPLNLLAGFGAAGAILLLIYKDSLQGLIAALQLAGNKMLALGDWIEVPQYNVYGDVVDITLLTVRVRNRDQSIVSIPAYALISQSFINWKAMQRQGARQIKRSINIDISTIKICSEALLQKLRVIAPINAYLAHQEQFREEQLLNKRVTNLELLQIYLKDYLYHHPLIHQDMFCLARQLEANQYGIPLEIYCYSKQTELEDYELLQSEIFNHLFAVVSDFELMIFQIPSGEDFQQLFTH